MLSTTDERTLERAFDLHSARQFDEAERIYRQVLRENPRHPIALHLLGVLLFQLNKLEAAEESIRAAIAVDPQSAEFHASLGMVLASRHELRQSLEAYQKSLSIQPKYVKAYFGLAGVHYELGEAEAAIVAYRRVLWLDPDHVDAQSNLGNALQLAGRADEATEAFRQALRHQPDNAQAHYNLGTALQSLSRIDEAAAAYREAIRLRPDFAEPYDNLGLILQRAGKIDEAIEFYGRALATGAESAAVYNNLGNAMSSLGRLMEARDSFLRAIELDETCVEAHNNLGTAWHKLGRPAEAIDCYRRALSLRPDSASIFNNLGNVMKEVGWLDEALACYDRALALNPDDAEFYTNAGNALKDAGQLDAAMVAYRRAMALRPTYPTAYSALLYALHFHPEQKGAVILEEHLQWNAQHAKPLSRLIRIHENEPAPDRKLRIGYVSPNFRGHVVGRFILPLLEHHDREKFETFCYADVTRPDRMTDLSRSAAGAWRSTVGFSDQRLAEQVREDRIDILVDLTMHMGGSRLLAFARKPAPVQVTYLAYCGTTGLSTMDYRLTDPYLDPPDGNDARYSEKSIRLPRTYWCYRPPAEAPEVGELPALSNGYITFGCLNNFCKVTPAALELWGTLLREMPHSRLLLHAYEGAHRQRVLDRFAEWGIDPARIEFVGFLPMFQYLQQYGRIDIALDPFPYGGGTTSCDALWMGTPVVTLAGEAAVSRSGLSILSNIGLEDLVAASPEEYVGIVRTLSADLSRLATLRRDMRARMTQSPLMDEVRFARDVETSFRGMWKAWCAGK